MKYDRPKISAEARALATLLSIVQHGDAPAIGNLPQVDLASRWYVRLANEVEVQCTELGIIAEDANP